MKKEEKESFGVFITASDYGRKKETVHKTKLATEDKTVYKWCRNCNCKNKNKEITCTQCGRTTFATRKLR